MLYFDVCTSTHFEFPPMSQDKKQLHSTRIKSPFHLRGHDLDISFPKGKTYLLYAGQVVPVISSNTGKYTAVSVVAGNCICASPWKFKMSIESPLSSWYFGKEYEDREKFKAALFQYLSCYFLVLRNPQFEKFLSWKKSFYCVLLLLHLSFMTLPIVWLSMQFWAS